MVSTDGECVSQYEFPSSGGCLPQRRIVLIGASNLARSFATLVSAARAVWDEPLEIMAAVGHGRSFGRPSAVLGRKISGILSCGLWDELHRRPALPTTALVTDIGNDILYGAAPELLLEWVTECLRRLAESNSKTIVTALPIPTVESLGVARFVLFRSLFFPFCRLTLNEVIAAAQCVNERLPLVAEMQKSTVFPVSLAWYGIDPVHIRRTSYATAWATILSGWKENQTICKPSSSSIWESAYLRLLPPMRRSFFGIERVRAQPSGVLSDGTTLSLY